MKYAYDFDNGFWNVLFTQIVHDVVLLYGKRKELEKIIFVFLQSDMKYLS